ncbi:hypothetical protein [Ligilactobacillus ceti]|uniref:Uncharacterized protein n=1 Tax=Ligilactobacillus ceti DSM 22408 TaxID=1122146 RepID=A0A0R2KIX5_9LACO|nr:hypothetical protein [Ligilactobacillus ceti]KRN89315.1 hypothetical protein IV53_GL000032 [Ligilactobacillus ceti DSM 22408]
MSCQHCQDDQKKLDDLIKEECRNLCIDHHLIEEAEKKAQARFNKMKEERVKKEMHKHQ